MYQISNMTLISILISNPGPDVRMIMPYKTNGKQSTKQNHVSGRADKVNNNDERMEKHW